MAVELTVVTPDGQAFAGQVEQVVLPGTEGDFGVLEQHERLLVSLRPGPLEIRTADGHQWAAVTDGYADVGSDQVTVMVSRCDLKRDLDPAAIAAEIAEIEAALNELSGADENEAARRDLELLLAGARAREEVVGRPD